MLLQVKLTTVEIDKAMVEVAKTWFGFQTNSRHIVEVADGLHYLNKCAENGKILLSFYIEIQAGPNGGTAERNTISRVT